MCVFRKLQIEKLSKLTIQCIVFLGKMKSKNKLNTFKERLFFGFSFTSGEDTAQTGEGKGGWTPHENSANLKSTIRPRERTIITRNFGGK